MAPAYSWAREVTSSLVGWAHVQNDPCQMISENMYHWITDVTIYTIHMWYKGFLPNTKHVLNPICSVATNCRQVHCMYWGHLSLFRRGTCHSNWYAIVCMTDLSHVFIRIEFTYMFSMCLRSEEPMYFHWRFIAVWHRSLLFIIFVCIKY